MWIQLSSKWQQKDQKANQQDQKWREGVPLKDMDWSGMVSQFCMNSSLHGLQYVGQPRRHSVERIFWLLSIGAAVTCATVLILQIWEKYRVTPIITVFQPEATPINLLPFPAITICNMNNVKKSKAVEYRRNDTREAKVRTTDWDSLNFDTDNIILDNEYTFEKEYEEIHGTRPKFPRRQRRPGKKTGLSILLDADNDDYFCGNTDSVGFMALAHLPLDLPDVENKGVPIKPGTETYLKVEPDVITAGQEIKEFSIEKRKCYFGQEYSLKYFKYYTKSNCENECVANVTNRNCSCVRFYMPRSENQQICGLMKRNCTESLLNRLFEDGLEAECPMCLQTCNDIEFKMSSTFAPLRQDIPLAGRNVSILHVHYVSASTYPKQRKELYGLIDLISNTGGLLGLCMGFSVLSILEIVYFLTLRLYCQSRSGRNISRKLAKRGKKIWGEVKHCCRHKDTGEEKIFYYNNGNEVIIRQEGSNAKQVVNDVKPWPNEKKIVW
ncbi:Pickpocket protein 28 [Folsomia candida]|uniref:Pickpocket protein 28 n=1 Tax=Folsomia candida TaxID=158441 RepID=A0A226DRR1_FOLCA|nr:Pickpocket protein 28 [Folsomia candida]